MTKREYFEKIKTYVENYPEYVEFLDGEIARLDARAGKVKAKRAEKAKENEPIKENIKEVLADGGLMASEIGEKVGHSTQKVTALCRQMVEDGTLKAEDVKVKGKGKRKAYSLA